MIPLGKFGKTVMQGLTLIVKHHRIRRGSAIIFFLTIFTLLLYVDFFPNKVNLHPGDVAPYEIRAPRSAEYVDPVKTDELKQQAMEAVDDVYTVDPQVVMAVESDIDDLAGQVTQIQLNDELTIDDKVNKLQAAIPFELHSQVLGDLATGSPSDVRLVHESITTLIIDRMRSGVTPQQLDDVKAELTARVPGYGFSRSYQQYAVGLVQHFTEANRFYNALQTEAIRAQAAEAVEPVKVEIKAQQRIVAPGDIVTQQQILALQALGLLQPRHPWITLLGMALLVAAMMASVLFYLRQQNRDIYNNINHLYLLGLVAVIVLAVSKMLVAIEVARWPQFGELFGYLAPVAAAGMLIAILLESRLAVLMVAVMSLFIGIMTGGQLNFTLVAFLGGITGVYSVSKLSQRGELATAGLITGVAVMLSIFIVGLVDETHWQLLLLSGVVLGLLNGLLSSVLTNGALPYLESTFGITSSVKLLELANPSNPLLRQLLTEAPGTYHHSIMVGNLAEAATEAVGGDHLLVRVGALYHDIGKIKRPYFFIENQMAADNPHDKIAPTLSTLILTSHVKDGADLAREHKLPQRVIDIIEQHHGNGLVKFFYHKAMEGERPDTVNEEDFRYDAPRPRSREAAIVMLADSVEAAVRAMKDPSSGQVEGLVRKLIKDKLMDGQLDKCDLTLKDLDTIANAFLRVLSGIFHSRIEYPDMQKEMERRKSSRGGSRK
ncbi:HD family phosphohydrolase [Desulfofalx alkaliphila]|uniref:HD family phosphohydrolase n=1 Tax=Desulfofalx alkaliphila TaxID=105483 RepID=UPI0004E1F964|nr:HDIG domain-containing metalloprotein [Desulfofalx alkaliphila]